MAGVLITTLGCYHATINTGLTPSTTVINKSWASGWLWGLVPPSEVATASRCSNGVAKVETQHSFLNMLAGALTGGIYSPIAIKVTCAQGGRSSLPSTAPTIDVGPNLTAQQWQTVISSAAELSLRTDQAVYIQY